ncbi:hypothetical protein [Burkholderia ambifaria]|uniref:hypothetical protein n=1 Tax=Burkholderia ambifaria TaxID=152480 RepID=UPI00158B7E5C|nr:hypothetical protein [Burkholderia ambifaria]
MKVNSSSSAPSVDDAQPRQTGTEMNNRHQTIGRKSNGLAPALTGLASRSRKTSLTERPSASAFHSTAFHAPEQNPFLQPSHRDLMKSATAEIAHTLEELGTGLLVHGSKPGWFIEQHDEKSGYTAISSLIESPLLKLRDGFTLIRLESSPGSSRGFVLVNKKNLLDLANEPQAYSYFIDTLCPGQTPPTHQLVDEYIIPAIAPSVLGDSAKGEALMGVVLGFGVSSALQFNSFTPEAKLQRLKWLTGKTAESHAHLQKMSALHRVSNRLVNNTVVPPHVPSFIPADDPVAIALVDKYHQESAALYDHWKSLKKTPAYKDLKKNEMIAADFLGRLFKAVPANGEASGTRPNMGASRR